MIEVRHQDRPGSTALEVQLAGVTFVDLVRSRLGSAGVGAASKESIWRHNNVALHVDIAKSMKEENHGS